MSKRSWVWRFCTKIENYKAKCDICDRIFSIGSSTSSLNKHLTNIHSLRTEDEAVQNKRGRYNTSTNEDNTSEENNVTAQFDNREINGQASSNSRRVEQNSEIISQTLAKMISITQLPISFVSSKGFRNFMKIVNPTYKVPCSETILKRIKLLYTETKSKLQDEFNNEPIVSLTTDCWTSRSQESYLTITIHFINKNWICKAFTLTTEEMEENHTAENLARRLEKCIDDWGLKNKVVGIVHDNARNIINTVDLMEQDIKGVCCAAHTIQLSVKKGLNIKEIEEVCTKSSKIVSHFRHSALATSALEKKQDQLELPRLQLIQKCPTRWNSSFYMCERLFTITSVLADRITTKVDIARKLEMSENDWSLLEDIINVLKPIEIATVIFSSEKNVSISIIRPIIHSLIDKHLIIDPDDSNIIIQLKTILAVDLSTRFQLQPNIETSKISILQLASFLDPRHKDLDFESENVRTLIHEAVKSILRDMVDDNIGSQNIPKIKKNCFRFYIC